MQLFVLGATGGPDRELIRQALNRWHMSLGRGNFVHQGGMRKLKKPSLSGSSCWRRLFPLCRSGRARPILEITTDE
jgi:hypothetical protein